ncbi:hypothetical protein D3C76_1341840 [compost metagenome]
MLAKVHSQGQAQLNEARCPHLSVTMRVRAQCRREHLNSSDSDLLSVQPGQCRVARPSLIASQRLCQFGLKIIETILLHQPPNLLLHRQIHSSPNRRRTCPTSLTVNLTKSLLIKWNFGLQRAKQRPGGQEAIPPCHPCGEATSMTFLTITKQSQSKSQSGQHRVFSGAKWWVY